MLCAALHIIKDLFLVIYPWSHRVVRSVPTVGLDSVTEVENFKIDVEEPTGAVLDSFGTAGKIWRAPATSLWKVFKDQIFKMSSCSHSPAD
jgi:hypothetical protein